jgi:hypothetical protein
LAEVVDRPGHVRVLVDHLLDNLLAGIVEIVKMLLHVECLLLLAEWGELWVRHKLFEIAEIFLFSVFDINLVLVLLGLKILVIVSFKERINSLDIVVLQELREVQHHHLLVLNAIDLKNVV